MTTSPAVPYTLIPGAAAVPITDGGNSPAGLTLLNRGDHGGTVWIQPGPGTSSAAIPLGAFGSIQWTDPYTVPYAYMAAGGQAETLVVTAQADTYSNPIAVATTLAAQGIPSVLVGQTIIDRALVPADGYVTADVSGYASLVVMVTFGNAGGGSYVPTNVRMDFTAPSSAGAVPCGTQMLTADPSQYGLGAGGIALTWVTPVTGPTAQFAVWTAAPGAVRLTVYGSNRTVPKFRQFGTLTDSSHFLKASCPTTANVQCLGQNADPTFTQHNGPISVMARAPVSANAAGTLFMNYVSTNGVAVALPIPITGNGIQQLAHPAVPCTWTFTPAAAVAANSLSLVLTAA